MSKVAASIALGFAAILSVPAHAGIVNFTAPVVANAGVVGVGRPNASFTEEASEGRFTFGSEIFDAFCFEVYQGSVFPTDYTKTTNWADGSQKRQLVGRLFAQYYATYKNDRIGTSAMQSTLWEILEDTADLNFTKGRFFFDTGTDTAVSALASVMLASVIAGTNSNDYSFNLFLSPDSQDLIQVVKNSIGVPVPGSAALLGLGLIGFWGLKRKQ